MLSSNEPIKDLSEFDDELADEALDHHEGGCAFSRPCQIAE